VDNVIHIIYRIVNKLGKPFTSLYIVTHIKC